MGMAALSIEGGRQFKALSKAAKKKLLQAFKGQPGRPRADGAREPSGRLSRSGIDHEPADNLALAVRARKTRLPAKFLRDQKAATFIGRLSIFGAEDGLSERQYAALVEFLDRRRDYLLAIKAPAAERDSGVRGGGNPLITAEYERWCRSTVQQYYACRDAIQAAQNHERDNLWGAIDVCVIRDVEAWHLLGALRLVGNALAVHFRA